ncbi:MAG: dihydrodipicolinate synthase family protein [Caldilineaceae bacterium]|nr:dihydrodipicolinate synthase family protein [Caldilineaceae bacterium]
MSQHPLSDIRGLVCPMVTPFAADGALDLAAARQVVDFLIAHGVQVLFPAGSTGEGALLTQAEREALAAAVVDQAAGRVPVIVHTGAITTAETVALTRHAQAIGASAASVITPYFFTYDEESVFAHYLAVAQAVPDFPVFVYAFPGNAKNDISPALLARLRAAAPNIAGFKSSNGDLIRFQEYIDAIGPGGVPLCGVDGLMLAALALGSVGQVSGNSNATPELFRRVYDTFRAGDLEAARAAQTAVNRARRALRDGVHLAYFKAALTLRGVPAGRVRAPMRELAPAQIDQLRADLQGLGVL